MTLRQVVLSAVVLTALTLLAVFLIDGPVALQVQGIVPAAKAAVNPFVTAVELLFGFPLSKFATGAFLVLLSLALFPVARLRSTAWAILYLGVTHLTARLIAGVLKNVFLRARPYEAVAGSEWQDRFFIEGGSSMPSGHAAHFWALFFAVTFTFPRLRIPALILAILVSISRVVVNDHYVSDVLASAVIAAFVSAGLALAFRRKLRQQST
ncbi:MAG TPA: phosphatase PAP2 family protein [Thermoanaerobaculia bacterium]|nr:phosphatase PAP2 family protein [Thermoanaerobaculia bacterium]